MKYLVNLGFISAIWFWISFADLNLLWRRPGKKIISYVVVDSRVAKNGSIIDSCEEQQQNRHASQQIRFQESIICQRCSFNSKHSIENPYNAESTQMIYFGQDTECTISILAIVCIRITVRLSVRKTWDLVPVTLIFYFPFLMRNLLRAQLFWHCELETNCVKTLGLCNKNVRLTC